MNFLKDSDIGGIPEDHIHDILAMNYANGDPQKAAEFIELEQQSINGIIAPYNPEIKLLGSENNGYVTCYLDSLLFSMFAKLEAYESILKNTFPTDDPRYKLVNLLRLWVNMLRLGKLIHTDIVELLQKSLAECGWKEALLMEQQDTSEAFAFITETLQLPLLPLQVDLFHQGKKDDDDHKVVYERLLNIAVPADPEGKGIALEDCLEEYFNTQVDVMRDNEVLKKVPTEDARALPPLQTHTEELQVGIENGQILSESPVDVRGPTPIQPLQEASHLSDSTVRPQVAQVSSDTPTSTQVTFAQEVLDHTPQQASSSTQPPPRRPSTRTRSASVIQKMMIDDKGRSKTLENETPLNKAKRTGSIIVKAVTIPAWQFFRLIRKFAFSKILFPTEF